MIATVRYDTPAASADEALDIADNWLSMFLAHSDPSSGEDYDLDAAVAKPTGAVHAEDQLEWFAVRVPVTYTETTDRTLLGFIEPVS